MLPVLSPCLPGTSIPNHCSYPGVSGVKGKGEELTPPHVYILRMHTQLKILFNPGKLFLQYMCSCNLSYSTTTWGINRKRGD